MTKPETLKELTEENDRLLKILGLLHAPIDKPQTTYWEADMYIDPPQWALVEYDTTEPSVIWREPMNAIDIDLIQKAVNHWERQ